MSDGLKTEVRLLRQYYECDRRFGHNHHIRVLGLLEKIVDRLESMDRDTKPPRSEYQDGPGASNPHLYVRLKSDGVGRGEKVTAESFWGCNDQEAIDYFGTSNAVYRRIDCGPTS